MSRINAKYILALTLLIIGIIVIAERARADEVAWTEKKTHVYRAQPPAEFTAKELRTFLKALGTTWHLKPHPTTGTSYPVLCIIPDETVTCFWMPDSLMIEALSTWTEL